LTEALRQRKHPQKAWMYTLLNPCLCPPRF